MNKRKIVILSVAPAVVLGLIISFTVISTIPIEPSEHYIRVIEPKEGAELSGIANIVVEYSYRELPDRYKMFVEMFVDGEQVERGGGTSPLIISWDTTWFHNGPHVIELRATDPYANVTKSEKGFYNINNPTYRTQDFIYKLNHSIDIGEFAEEIGRQTGLKLIDSGQVGSITSVQDPCGKWAKIKIHFYSQDEIEQTKAHARDYTGIASALPLTKEQIEKTDSLAQNWDKTPELSLQERTGRACP